MRRISPASIPQTGADRLGRERAGQRLDLVGAAGQVGEAAGIGEAVGDEDVDDREQQAAHRCRGG